MSWMRNEVTHLPSSGLHAFHVRVGERQWTDVPSRELEWLSVPLHVLVQSLRSICTPSQGHYGNAHCLLAKFRQRNREHLHFMLLHGSSGGPLTTVLLLRASVLALFNSRARCNCICKYVAAVCFALSLSCDYICTGYSMKEQWYTLWSSCTAFNCRVFHMLVMSLLVTFTCVHYKARTENLQSVGRSFAVQGSFPSCTENGCDGGMECISIPESAF